MAPGQGLAGPSETWAGLRAIAATKQLQATQLSVDKTVAADDGTIARCMAPMLFIAAFMIALVAWAWCSTQPGVHTTNEIAASLSNTQLFVQHMNYTLILPYSYLTAVSVGLGAVYSGFLIGMYMTGVMLGSVMMWFLLVWSPTLWEHARRLSLAAASCNLLGSAIYCAISSGIDTTGAEDRHSSVLPISGIAIALLGSRLLDGFGTGIIVQLAVVNVTHLFASKERPSQMANNQFAVMMGIGLGPLMGSAVCKLDFCHPDSEPLAACGIAYVGTAVAALIVVAVRFPELHGTIEDHTPAQVPSVPAHTLVQNEGQSKQESQLSLRTKIIIASSGLAMNAMRGFVISGLEAATSLLLEDEYGWNRNDIGVVIGVCFLACVPVKAFYERSKSWLKVTQWIRLMSILAIAGSLLLFSPACHLLGPGGKHCGVILLLGDAVLFPTLFLGDSLNSGLMMMSQHLLSAGSWFDANHIILYRGLAVAGCGRTFGPPLARSQIAAGGQNSYASQQLVLAAVYLLMFEIFIAPRAQIDDET